MIKNIFFCVLVLATMYSCKDAKADGSTETNTEVAEAVQPETKLRISLAQWSLNKELNGGTLDNLEFAAKASELGATGIEYVNQFFADKAEDQDYLDKMNKAAADAGVEQLLIMIDNEGDLGDPDSEKRNEAVDNHKKWVDAAAYLGCHSIRVNAFGKGTPEEVGAAAKDALGKLSAYGATKDINVIVENHGSYSSDGKWLTDVISSVGMDNCGTLPDFGNFCVKRKGGAQWDGDCIDEYDRYKGVEEMMPYAKGVSAKSHDFDSDGNETATDFKRMMDIVKASGYTGYVGIEYEGSNLGAEEGIIATRKLLEKYL